MLKLRHAQQGGMFHEAFDDMFPPESGEEQRQDDQPARQTC
jgi:hypothetical protein